jgi:hypothetical protein
MKAASVNELKKELESKNHIELLSFCMRLARFKKENKELLTFLLFEADDIITYVENVKEEITGLFNEINSSNIYYIKKGVRKILRYLNKYIKFSSSKQAEAEIRIHFCNCMIQFSTSLKKSNQLLNMYKGQLKKIDETLATLHADLQYDLKKQLKII